MSAMNQAPNYRVFPDEDTLARAAAAYTLELATRSVATGGRFLWALTGGSSPRPLYALLAQPPFHNQFPWDAMDVIWGDERYVPHDDPESCYHLAYETMLAHVPIPSEHVYPIPTHFSQPEDAAAAYHAQMQTLLAAHDDQIDLVLLGLGPDGHIASLFPGHPALDAPADRYAVAVLNAPKSPPTRISLTATALNRAAHVLFLVTGADKAAAVHAIRHGPHAPHDWPGQLVRPPQGSVTWFVDQAADGG